MYYSKRPPTVPCTLAGGVLTLGAVAIVARGLHSFTSFTLAPPFDALGFIVGVTFPIAGLTWLGWLVIGGLREQIRALTAENENLRSEQVSAREVIAAVVAVDQQVEVNGVKLSKIQETVRDLWQANAEQQTQPIAPLRSIKGNGAG
ncbi:hypothetical protein [Micromonospora sp. NBRC 107095]|uniref:hypothetical protein n=1 Tax=Micromonospora sp. NBRC 107095 TaxID=3032209 RepID=UPI0024A31CFF|nr:hypothetical protein [Micromonospora sp. NBRC 107095]GLZ62903.1 hypothetical protein Misp05_64790 [Micromonospora sp. NBRC 107095]